jgi:hypothetical protein
MTFQTFLAKQFCPEKEKSLFILKPMPVNYMRLFFLSMFLFLLTNNSNASTYYVSSTGNDLNDGLTDTTAWQTIAKVDSFTFSAGDTIAFEGGSTFFGHVINASFSNATELNRITITSYGNGWATISGGPYDEGISIVNAGFITVTRLFLKGTGTTVNDLYTIYYNGIGVYLDKGITFNADNIVLDSIDASGYGGFGIMMSCDSKTANYRHLRVTNSLLHDNSMGGIQITGYADSVAHLFSHFDLYVGYCKAYNNLGNKNYPTNWSGCGILVSGLENGLVEYCETYNNGRDNGALYAGPVGIFLGEARFVTIEHCISHHNLGGLGHRDGGGFDLDQGSYGCVIQYCESYENEGAGYGLYQAPTPNPWSNDTIRYNTSVNDGRNTQYYSPITFWGQNSNYKVKNAQVYGNTITMNKPGYALNFINTFLDSAMIYNNSFCIEPPASFLNYTAEFPVPRSAMIFNNTFPCTVKPQQPFILPVTFRGAFAPSPTTMWSSGWTNYDPQSVNYGVPDSIIQTNITSNLNLIGTKRYLLKGAIYVTNGAVLNIASGAQIRFDKSTPNSALIITRGSKIYANGSATRPIIFTSNQAPGQRAAGDWAGVFILGNAGYNAPGGIGNLNAFPVSANTEFGGGNAPFDDDSSGIFQFVRIEFAGSTLTPSSRNDGLTLAAVGRGTVVDHVQVSFSNNDGFKWMGGAVNCRYLVSYKNADDNWDVSFGYHGAVQYGLGLRDPLIFTDAVSEIAAGSESSNDSTGSSLTPLTSPVFCNFTDIGPLRGNNAAVVSSAYNQGVKYFRNSRLRMVNSIVMDYPAGVGIFGTQAVDAATGNFISSTPNSSPGNLVFKNNLVAGSNSNKVLDTDISWDMPKWFGQSRNDSLLTTDTILILPYATGNNNSYTGDYRPTVNSAALKNYNWNDSSFYYIDSTGKTSNLIPCPIFIVSPALIVGNTNAYLFVQSGDTVKYYLATKSNDGVLRYNWTVPSGVNIESGQGTDTLVVRYTNSFTSGDISVKNLTYCGTESGARTLTINKIAPKTYTFTGNGLWNDPANWSNATIPPSTLPFSDEIIIAHAEDGSCILNVPQIIARGAKLTVQQNKNLTIQGNFLQLKF